MMCNLFNLLNLILQSCPTHLYKLQCQLWPPSSITHQVEARGQKARAYEGAQLHTEFKASLGHMSLLKTPTALPQQLQQLLYS